ncbi:hypothetical protein EOD39_0136 [Acipenser ruthenus]|uniref:Uncharacterized protein n=1 Tax=Acipenser ruthenus TaxID=7906 RepID=A0A444UGW4_ACIRT|nr:hypothetical protein EOD39_0136 [Acipenser ruthenus]
MCEKSQFETTDQYIAKLRKMVGSCEYGTLKKDMMRDRLVITVKDTGLSPDSNKQYDCDASCNTECQLDNGSTVIVMSYKNFLQIMQDGKAKLQPSKARLHLRELKSGQLWDWIKENPGLEDQSMPMVIDALRQRDGDRWKACQRGHRPRSLEEVVELVLCYLEADMEKTTAQAEFCEADRLGHVQLVRCGN